MNKELINKLKNLIGDNAYYKNVINQELTEEEQAAIQAAYTYENNYYKIEGLDNAYIAWLKCTECGEDLYILIYSESEPELYEILDGEYYHVNESEDISVCDSCYCDYYFTCYHCGDVRRSDDGCLVTSEYGDEEYYCLDCVDSYAWRCEICDTLHSVNNSSYDLISGGVACQNCRDNGRVYYCDACGGYDLDDNVIFNEDADRYHCEECEEIWQKNHNPQYITIAPEDNTPYTSEITEDRGGRGCLDSWHHPHRAFNFIKTTEDADTEELFCGCELEITDRHYDISSDKMACIINHINNNYHFITEADSSINGNGVELISDAITFKAWDSLKARHTKLFKDLLNLGFTSDSGDTGCGLHFHVSRAALGNTREEQADTIARIELILENFKSEIMQFSRRNFDTLNRWASFISDRTGDGALYSIDLIKEKKNSCLTYGERYQALNLTNDKTIEFRFFKGTLNIKTFYASLYLVKNIVELAKTPSAYAGTTWAQLIKRGNHSELIEYNKNRNIISKSRLKDWTERLRVERIRKDAAELRRFNKQAEILRDLADLLQKNKKIFEEWAVSEMVRDSYIYNRYKNTLNNLYNQLNTAPTPDDNIYSDLMRAYAAVTDVIATRTTYTTAGGVRYQIIPDQNAAGFKDKINELKRIIKELGGVI